MRGNTLPAASAWFGTATTLDEPIDRRARELERLRGGGKHGEPDTGIEPVYFEDILDTHRWVMAFIAETEQKVHQTDGNARDTVWKEAVWALGVQKRCLELELRKGRTKGKEEMRATISALTLSVLKSWERIEQEVTKHERKLAALGQLLQSVRLQTWGNAQLVGVQKRERAELAACRSQLVQKERECAELTAYRSRQEQECAELREWATQCRQDTTRQERELQQANVSIQEMRSQLRQTEEALEHSRAQHIEVTRRQAEEIADAVALSNDVWQQRVDALQKQLLRHEAACEVGSGREGKRAKDMVDILREVRSLERNLQQQ